MKIIWYFVLSKLKNAQRDMAKIGNFEQFYNNRQLTFLHILSTFYLQRKIRNGNEKNISHHSVHHTTFCSTQG